MDRACLLLTMAASVLLARPAAADDAAVDQERQQQVARLAPAKARQLQLNVGRDRPEKAILVERPLLRWSNPTAGSVYGEVFLWTAEGRPSAVASIYRWYHPYRDSTVEIVSLSSNPLEAQDEAQVVWQAPAEGLVFRPLKDAPEPGPGDAVRASQMRSLAREFTAELVDARGGEQVVRKLRLMPQPVFRYDRSPQKILDGAMFCFAESTDPEAWLLLEVTGGEKWSWRYALARMNADEIKVVRREEVVAHWQKISQPWKHRQGHYRVFSFDPSQVGVSQP